MPDVGLYVGTKLALDAQTDDDFDNAANAFAHGLSTAATDVAALGTGKVAGKVAGEAVSPTKQLVKQIGDKGLQPFLREGIAGFGRHFHAFWLDDTGTLWLDKHSRALNRILHSQKLTLTAQAAAKLEEAANAGKMKTTQEALGTFRKILEKEGLDWSKLSDKAQAEVEAIAKEFAAPAGPTPGWRSTQTGTTSGNSRILRRNLGLQEGSGSDAHHIVESTGSRARPARNILDRLQIDINEAANGVPLKPTGARPAHRGQRLHSDAGIDAVNKRLTFATQGINDWATARQAALDELAALRAKILNGTFP